MARHNERVHPDDMRSVDNAYFSKDFHDFYPHITLVPEGTIYSANYPVVSMGFMHCQALVISDGIGMAVSHILPTHNPRDYINKSLTQVMRKDNLLAIILETIIKETVGFDVEKACREYGIRVIASMEQIPKSREFPHIPSVRNLLCIPDTGEVRIYSKKGRDILKF